MTTINYLTTIEFEHGAIRKLPDALGAVGISRPLVVTDKGIVACGLLEELHRAMPNDVTPTLFDDTPANPTDVATEQALVRYREADCDGLVAFGGGSSMDLAKAAGVLASHRGSLEDFQAVRGGMEKITDAMAPLIAIPTTSGTGSEIGRGAVISFRDGSKRALLSPHLVPKRALCDPDLTLGLPPGLTAATGMDALSHCVESFLSPRVNPPAEAIGLDGAARAWTWLERAVADGSDPEARWQMMMAALQGGMTFQKGLGSVHAMSHPLGALKDLTLHHGTLNAVILPAVLRFNESHVGDKYARLRAALGLASGADFAAEVEALNARLTLPANLREMGVSSAVIPSCVEAALVDHCNATNPRTASAEDYTALFEAAMG